MKLQLALGLGLGAHRKVGGEPYVTPTLPEAQSIVRAWSIRRLIPAYKNHTAIKADRTDPLGGDPDDGFLVPFRNDGTILIPNGDDAYAYELHEQHGVSAAKLINPVFANCPKVLDSNAMKKGLDWSHKASGANNNLYMAVEDATIETTFLGSFSVIVWAFCDATGQSIFYRTKSNGSGTWGIRTSNAESNRITYRLSGVDNITFTPDAGNTYNGKWASFAFTVDRTGAPSYNVYLNGINIGTGALDTASAGANNTIRIGSGLTTTNAKAVNDLAIWNVTLSDAQMLSAHNAMAPYYAPPEVR